MQSGSRRATIVGLVAYTCLYPSLHAAQTPKSLNDARHAIVLVRTDNNKAGTGFLWGEPNRIITALHVIAGSSSQSVTYNLPNGKVVREAKFVQSLPKRDLAILEVLMPVKEAPFVFREVQNNPQIGEKFAAMAYRLRIARPSPVFLQVADAELPMNKLLPRRERQTLQRVFDLEKPVINLQGPHVSGISGCPLVNDNGAVVGIGQGGIIDGTISNAWAIPATEIRALEESNDETLPPDFTTGTLLANSTEYFFELTQLDPEGIVLYSGDSKTLTIGGSSERREVQFIIPVEQHGKLRVKASNLNPKGRSSGRIARFKLLDLGGNKLAELLKFVAPNTERKLGPAYVEAGQVYLVHMQPSNPAQLVRMRVEIMFEPQQEVVTGDEDPSEPERVDITNKRTIRDSVGLGQDTEDIYIINVPKSGAISFTIQNATPKGTKNSILRRTEIAAKGRGKLFETRPLPPSGKVNTRKVPVNKGDIIAIRIRPRYDHYAVDYILKWSLN